MNRLSTSLATLAALAVFCATLTYWVITLATPMPLALGATNARPPATVDAAARLFGDDQVQDVRLRLFGILALNTRASGGIMASPDSHDRPGAAAIVSLDGGPAQAIGLGQTIGGSNGGGIAGGTPGNAGNNNGNANGSGITLAEVHARSIIVDRNGVRSEVTMAAPTAGPGGGGAIIYMH